MGKGGSAAIEVRGGTHLSRTSKWTLGNMTADMTSPNTLGFGLVRLAAAVLMFDLMPQTAGAKFSATRGSRCRVAPRWPADRMTGRMKQGGVGSLGIVGGGAEVGRKPLEQMSSAADGKALRPLR